MEQQYSIEQVLNAKISQKAQQRIGQLSAQLFEAEAKAELLQDLYNDTQKQLNELKGQTPDESPAEPVEAEIVEVKPNRAQRRQLEKQQKQK